MSSKWKAQLYEYFQAQKMLHLLTLNTLTQIKQTFKNTLWVENELPQSL